MSGHIFNLDAISSKSSDSLKARDLFRKYITAFLEGSGRFWTQGFFCSLCPTHVLPGDKCHHLQKKFKVSRDSGTAKKGGKVDRGSVDHTEEPAVQQ